VNEMRTYYEMQKLKVISNPEIIVHLKPRF